jgi:1-acyl-sn-glycerol-3-phosphate acyltransferase
MSGDEGAHPDGLRDAVVRGLCDVLGLDGAPPAPQDDLAALGFDSLGYAELAAELREERGVDLLDAGLGPIRTVADLVDAAERAAAHPGVAGPLLPEGFGTRQTRAMSRASGTFRWWFDLTIVGADRMPATGPAVLCMNHESILDIPAVAVASTRPITFMAKKELFRNPRAARAFERLGAFRVDRDLFDLRAIRIGLDVVRRGEVLGMYPEGTRNPGTLLPFLAGAPWIALATGAPLVPCGIAGTERALPRGRRVPKRIPIRVTFLDPIPVEPVDDPVKRRTEAERLAVELHEAIAPLLSY